MKNNLGFQIFVAVILGLLFGSVVSFEKLSFLSEIAKVLIHWIKLLAGPFLFCTILASVAQVDLQWNHGFKLFLILFINTSMALGLALGLSTLFFTDTDLKSIVAQNTVISEGAADPTLSSVSKVSADLSLSSFLKTLSPSSLMQPFVNNDILLIAILGLIVGIAIKKSSNLNLESKKNIVIFFNQLRDLFLQMLMWIIKIIPYAIFIIIASTVSKYGFQIFISLSQFALVVTLGFILQVVFVYGFWIFIKSKISVRTFLKAARAPFIYSLGVNSSLATVPLTVNALKKLNVSERSISLGTGVATNLNNDGIFLYEVMAILFISFAYNGPLTFLQMLFISLTCLVASVGITGIPEAGFITLTILVGALGLPVEVLPLILSVDWILARFRSAVNVLSDMSLAIAMDAFETKNKSNYSIKDIQDYN